MLILMDHRDTAKCLLSATAVINVMWVCHSYDFKQTAYHIDLADSRPPTTLTLLVGVITGLAVQQPVRELVEALAQVQTTAH